jgi:dTDP-4-amino-4,6-dideoxygalactose transaminase
MSRLSLPVLVGGEPICTAPYAPFPRTFGDELEGVRAVLAGDNWLNGPATKRFEDAFAEYIGARNVVAVNTGGIALQIAMRCLGIEPGDEVLVQVDTCVADAFAIFNAGAAPIFADSNPETFMLDWDSIAATIGSRTKAIVPVHMWGRPEKVDAVAEVAKRHNLLVIDDACLACGAEWRGKKVGTFGQAGVFSFGCLKPFQAGGGGAIVTDDDSLAREMRVSRSWGETTDEFGIRDQRELAWNGRISDLISAVLTAQLKGYPAHLATLQENARRLERMIEGLPGIRLMDQDERITAQAHTQFTFKIEEQELGITLNTFAEALQAEGIPMVWHGAFEPMTTLSFFRGGRWRRWAVGHTDHDRLAENYSRPYPGAQRGFYHVGISIGRNVLCSGNRAVEDTARIIERICANAGRLAEWEHQQAKND